MLFEEVDNIDSGILAIWIRMADVVSHQQNH
jgi:hypothetical protein